MVKNHFGDDFFFCVIVERELISIAINFLNLFYGDSWDIVIDQKTKYWIVSLNDPPMWIPST